MNNNPCVPMHIANKTISMKQGFTLVELLVTISIIGLLASITMLSVGNVRQVARDSKRLADIKQLQTALEFYFNQTNGYPQVRDALKDGEGYIPLGDANHNVLCAATRNGFEANLGACGAFPVYMSKVPVDPQQNPITYYRFKSDILPGNNQPTAYQMKFNLETTIAGYAPGEHVARPSGVQ